MAEYKYTSKVKELSDAVYFPVDAPPDERLIMIKILDRIIGDE